jgi:hypothetical protein
LLTCFIFAFAILQWRGPFCKKSWVTAIVLALVFSLFLAFFSVSSVWIPYGLSDNVLHQQNTVGEYAGTFPWSELSYPLTLSVYHTPFENLTLIHFDAYGQASFSMLFAGTDILRTNGTYWYFTAVMGPMPLHYNINFVFSDPLQFFDYLLVLFTLFNFAGALLGISLAYMIERLKPIERTPNQRVIPRVDEDSTGARVKRVKMVALIGTIVWALMGAGVWDALLSSAHALAGGAENVTLFLFVSWVGFGFLLCYFLGSFTIAILKDKKG